MNRKLAVGDLVQKTGGDYTFTGRIVARFTKLSAAERVVVENKDGVLHIFNPSQLQYLPAPFSAEATLEPNELPQG